MLCVSCARHSFKCQEILQGISKKDIYIQSGSSQLETTLAPRVHLRCLKTFSDVIIGGVCYWVEAMNDSIHLTMHREGPLKQRTVWSKCQ